MKVTLTSDKLSSITLPNPIHSFPEWLERPGREHYRLLAYLTSNLTNATIIDIGTHKGWSALALSNPESNVTIHTFDIIDKLTTQESTLLAQRGVKTHIEDLWNPTIRENWKDTILASELIFLDVDPHNGKMEYDLYLWLQKNDYQGIIVCDDIWHFEHMRHNFWHKIPPHERMDLTPYGHWSGTGLICFHFENHTIESQMSLSSTSKQRQQWTFVTAYFNLTECSDASEPIKDRDAAYYMSHAKDTMSIPYNLVVYCDPNSIDILKSFRPPHLLAQTKWISISFEDIPLVKYQSIIAENRRTHPYHEDPRNTPSYYLLCMSRYWMLQNEIKENSFDTSHFAWINICMSRMGARNLAEIDRVVSTMRDRFSTCFIAYQPKSFQNDLQNYFSYGRCSLCSGFFTGNTFYMQQFCKLIMAKFREMLELGYGHADEQLFFLVYLDSPEIFQWYPGDYQSMITNYYYTFDDPDGACQRLIEPAYHSFDIYVAKLAAQRLIKSYNSGACIIEPNKLNRLKTIANLTDAS